MTNAGFNILGETKDEMIARVCKERDDARGAERDAIRETAGIADECAFWRYQAIWGRAVFLQPDAIRSPLIEERPVWKEATKQLEAAWTEDKRERGAVRLDPPGLVSP